MPEKINLDATNTDLMTVIKPDNGYVLPQTAGHWSDASLSHIHTREHVQPSISDQRMVIHIQRKNKHPHSTKKHK